MHACGRTFRSLAAVTLLAAALGGVQPAASQVTSTSSFQAIDGEGPAGTLPNRLAGQVGVIERLGVTAPTSGTFRDEAGRPVTLSSLLGHEKPVVLAFVYHSCPMLCSLILDGVAEGVRGLEGLRPGEDYEVVAVSIDPRDTPVVASRAKAKYMDLIGDPAVADGLHFWTVTEDTEPAVKQLAEGVGWGYAWDPATSEYAHNAAVVLLSPSGVVTRYLYGIQYARRDFRLAVVEAGDGHVGTTVDRFLLTCYAFDPDARSYSLAAVQLLKVGGGLLLVVFGGALALFWRREGRRQRADLHTS